MGDTIVSDRIVASQVDPEIDAGLNASGSGVSVWEGRALAAQDQLAALAHDLGEVSISPDDITPENIIDVEQQIYRAALIRGMRGDELSQLVYQVRKHSQDIQSVDGFDPSSVTHAPMDVSGADSLPLLQGNVVGARHGTALNVSSVLEAWQIQIDRVTEIAQIYEQSGFALQREAGKFEDALVEDALQELRSSDNRPHLEVVKK